MKPIVKYEKFWYDIRIERINELQRVISESELEELKIDPLWIQERDILLQEVGFTEDTLLNCKGFKYD